MAKKVKKHDGRTSDLTFKWMLTTLGPEWEQWQELAASGWRHSMCMLTRLSALSRFESYLLECTPCNWILVCFSRGMALSAPQEQKLLLRAINDISKYQN
jgi:hypothetical protein